jgi:positive regulator of sigma E activity
MPLFIVKREVFQLDKAGLKTIELRKGKAKAKHNSSSKCGACACGECGLT